MGINYSQRGNYSLTKWMVVGFHYRVAAVIKPVTLANVSRLANGKLVLLSN